MIFNYRRIHYLLLIFIFASTANAGFITSILSKAGKVAKAVKVVTVAEGANLLFSKLNKIKKDNALYIGEDASGALKIHTPKNESFTFNKNTSNFSRFLDDVKYELYKNKNNTVDIYIPEEVFFKNKGVFDRLSKYNRVLIHTGNKNLLKTKIVNINNVNKRVIIFKENILINVKSSDELINIYWSFSQPVYTSDISVISLFDKFDILTHSSLTRVAKERHISSKKLNGKNIHDLIKKQKGKTVFMIGHVEKNNFVIRGADNSVINKFSLKEIEKTAKYNNIPIVLLGCKTAKIKNISGYLKNTHDLEIIDNISKALHSKNYGDLFSAFSSTESPFILQAAIADDIALNIIAMKQVKNRGRAGKYMLVSQIKTTTASKSYIKEKSLRIIWFLPSWVHMAYFMAYLLSIFTFRAGWKLIKRKWVVSEYTIGQRVTSIWERFYRFIIYLIVLPFYTIFTCASLPFTITYDLLKIIYNIFKILYYSIMLSINFFMRTYEKFKNKFTS